MSHDTPDLGTNVIVLRGTIRPMTFPSPRDFGHWLRGRGFSNDTITSYTGTLRRAQGDLGDLRRVDVSDLGAWLGRYSGWTRRTYKNGLNAAYDWLELSGEIDKHPIRSLDKREQFKPTPAPEPAPDPLSPEEEAAVLAGAAAAAGAPGSAAHLNAWLMLGLRQGLRRSEIASFHGEMIQGRRLVVTGKGGKQAKLPLHDDIARLAKDYPRVGYWFPGRADRGHVSSRWLGAQVSMLFRTQGLHGSIHRCRHTYGTSLLREGADVRQVQVLMRHASLETTQRYLEAIDDGLTAAINRLGTKPEGGAVLQLV